MFVLQEYLEMQRQLAIQRLQEQEKERQMRLEQQKHTIQMRAQMPAFSLPYAQVHTLGWLLDLDTPKPFHKSFGITDYVDMVCFPRCSLCPPT